MESFGKCPKPIPASFHSVFQFPFKVTARREQPLHEHCNSCGFQYHDGEIRSEKAGTVPVLLRRNPGKPAPAWGAVSWCKGHRKTRKNSRLLGTTRKPCLVAPLALCRRSSALLRCRGLQGVGVPVSAAPSVARHKPTSILLITLNFSM
jgi:hypothetical protein